MNYAERDFRLTLGVDAPTQKLNVTLSRCKTDGTSTLLCEVRTDPFPTTLERDHLHPLANHAVRPFPEERLREYGRLLAERLLPEEIRATVCADISKPTRLRLTIDPFIPSLEIPWEYLYLDEDASGLIPKGFLCQLPNLHLIRQSSTPRAVTPIAAAPLHILVAWADPKDSGYAALPFLYKEVDAIEKTIHSASRDHIQMDQLKNVGPIALERSLRFSSPMPHILHFIGHGKSDRNGSALILQGEKTAYSLPADEFAHWLKGTSVRLVVLSACRTAEVHGIAQTLMNHGVPAVVAMQLPWRDSAAVPFARSFYTAIANRQCSVEEALQEARQVLVQGVDWGVPTLYLAGDSSAFFLSPTSPFDLPKWLNKQFVGYDHELKTVHETLISKSERRAALVGMGGVGKTELAIHYAHTYKRHYPGGVFFVNGRTAQTLRRSLSELGRRWFKVNGEQSTAEQVEATRLHLERLDRPALLICDDLEQDKLEPDAYRSILPVTGQTHLLVTSRDWFVRHDFHPIELKRLKEEDALILLDKYHTVVGEKEQTAARAIVEGVDGHPKALTLIGGYLETTLHSYVHYHQLLLRSTMPSDVRTRLNKLIEISFDKYRDLTKPQDALLLGFASYFDKRGISRELLWDAYRRSKKTANSEQFDVAVGMLIRLNLMEKQQLREDETEIRLGMHEVVRSFARGRLTSQQRSLVQNHIVVTLEQHLTTANQNMEWQRIRRELPHYYAVADLCHPEIGADPKEFAKLLYALSYYLNEHSDFKPALSYLKAGRQLLEATNQSHTQLHAQFLMLQSEVQVHLSDYESAKTSAQEALTIALDLIPNGPELAEFYNTMGYVFRRANELDAALSHYQTAKAFNDQEDQVIHPIYAIIINNMGVIYEEYGNLEEARNCFEEALRLNEVLFGPEHPKVAIRLTNIGRVVGEQGDWQTALSCHERALTINLTKYVREDLIIAMGYCYIAQAEYKLGHRDQALSHLQQAIEIFDHCGGSSNKFYLEVRHLIHNDAQEIEV